MNKIPKKILFACIAITGLSSLLLVLAEMALSLSGFGHETTPLIEVEVPEGPVWTNNPHFTHLYFPAALKRLPPPNKVPVEKGAKTRRYMLVGGSAAAGDPDPDFSVTRILEWMLSELHPDHKWELINQALIACNSHVGMEVVRQSEDYDLDGFIVMMGNNEVVGPFGPGSRKGQQAASLLKRDLEVAMRKTKLGQLGQAVRDGMQSRSKESDQWTGMRQFLNCQIAGDDRRLRKVYSNYRSNLEDILREAEKQGLPLILANVPVNLLDQPPFLSDEANIPADIQRLLDRYFYKGLSDLPPEEVQTLAQSYPRSADLQFMAGRILHEVGEIELAEQYLRAAVDEDLLRFRADSGINAIVSDIWEAGVDTVIPVDLEAALIENSPKELLGFPHFYEHVHFSFVGNYVIAAELAKALLKEEALPVDGLESLTWRDAATGLAYTNYDTYLILTEWERRFSMAPFTEIRGYKRFTEWKDPMRKALKQSLNNPGSLAAMGRIYERAIKKRPGDDRIKLNYANFLTSVGSQDKAYAIMREIHQFNPTDSELQITWFELCLKLQKYDEAEKALQQISWILTGHPIIGQFRKHLDAAMGK